MTKQEEIALFGGRENVRKLRDYAVNRLERLRGIESAQMDIATLEQSVEYYEMLLEEEAK
jgi:hypothetical protein